MPPDGKALSTFSVQWLDSFKYQFTVSRLFAESAVKQPGNNHYNRLCMAPHLVRASSSYNEIRIHSFHHTNTHTHPDARTHARTHGARTHTHTHTHYKYMHYW